MDEELWPGGAPELLAWTANYAINWLPLLLLPTALIYLWYTRTPQSAIRNPQSAIRNPHFQRRLSVLLLAWLVILVLGIALNLRFDLIGKHLYYTTPAAALAAGLLFSRLWSLRSAKPYPALLAALAALSVAWSALAFMAGRI